LSGTWAPGASWLLPAAGVGLVAGWLLTRGRHRRDPARAGLLLRGGRLLVVGVVLSSLRGISHSYHAVQLAPAVAPVALVAAAVAVHGLHAWPARPPVGAATLVPLLGGPAADPIECWAVVTFPVIREGDWLMVDLARDGG
jgi:hypothetical protein